MSVASVISEIEEHRLVAIIRLDSESEVVRAVEEMIEGGIRTIELSLTMPHAIPAIRNAVDAFGDEATFGLGTVMSADDADAGVDAGAKFLISPNLDATVVERAADLGILHLPGALTPSEVATATALGAPMIKVFPAGLVGPEYIADLLAPFPEARLVPTGRVDADNARSFLDSGAAAVAVAGALTGDLRPGEVLRRARSLRASTSQTETGGSS